MSEYVRVVTSIHAEVAYEFAVDAFEDNVIYFEVRFAPQLHASPDMDIECVLLSVNKVREGPMATP